ncbi:MAG TPA: DUF4468 domain-containing protein [Bacteroidia bacterium]|nr:DUF4468 domain-containing protein [Bacteroidia bacterium]
MKKFPAPVLFISALLTSAIVSAQINDKIDPGRFPIDVNSKLITYVEVIQVPGVPVKEIFSRGLKWFNTFYKNPTDVIRETDSLRGKIFGKARFKIYNPADKTGLKTEAGNVEYSITLNLKEGKFRYTITEINWKKASFYPVERWLDTTALSYSKAYSFYLEQMDTQIHETVKNLETFMKTPPAKKNDDW